MMVKTFFAVLLLAVVSITPLASAQDKPMDAPGAPGCGDPNARFEVNSDKGQHPAQPQAGKALVYFIQDDSQFDSSPKPTTRAGVDGKWVGTTHHNSYFYFFVDPGVQHLCASWQLAVLLGQGRKTAAAHFTAEPGDTYYFVAKDIWWRYGKGGLTLTPVDSDQGQLMVQSLQFATSHPKK